MNLLRNHTPTELSTAVLAALTAFGVPFSLVSAACAGGA